MKRRAQSPKYIPKSKADELLDRLFDMVAEKTIDVVINEGPKALGKLWDSFFSDKGEKKQSAKKPTEAKEKIITPDFSGLGDENWWEVLGVNINASETEIHDAAEKLLATRSSTKPVSEKTLRDRETNRKKIFGACLAGLAAIRANNPE